MSLQESGKDAIRSFHVNIPEAELTELRKRINAMPGSGYAGKPGTSGWSSGRFKSLR